MTVLDYVLMEIHSQLHDQAKYWQDEEKSGLWMSTRFDRPFVTARAHLSPETGKVLLGLTVSVYKFTKSPSEVCEFFIDNVIAPATAAGKTERKYRGARNSVMLDLLPRSLYGITSDSQRDLAFDEFQRSAILGVQLYESSTKRAVDCERPALGDSITVTERTAVQ